MVREMEMELRSPPPPHQINNMEPHVDGIGKKEPMMGQ